MISSSESIRLPFASGPLAVALLLGCGPLAEAQFFVDDFETDSSALYTVVDDGAPDGTVTFGFDYVAAGLPLAPNSAVGTTRGLRMTANDTAGATDAFTAFRNVSLSGSYTLQVDVYVGVATGSGTTEHAHVGIGGDGTTFNQLFSPISGSGHYLAFDGDGGSSSDFRHYNPSQTAVPSGDATYLNDLMTTNSTGDTYQAIFPAGTWDFPGSPGNGWTTLTIDVSGGNVTYAFDGTPIIRTAAEQTDGFASLGYADLFNSVASPAGSAFVVYDNFSVIPEPSAAALAGAGLLLGLVVFGRRRRAHD